VAEEMVCHFRDYVIKMLQLPFQSLSLSQITFFGESKLLFHEQLYGEPTWWGMEAI
jgi:hypothetical protein